MLRALVYIVPVALAVYALVDLARSREEERSGLSALAWVAIVVLLPVVGPIVWIVLSRRAAGAQGARPGGGGRPGPRRGGPVAPDDDPDFLWRLEQEQRRRRARDETAPEDESGGSSA
ncbi:PLDc_N domain-containing protein [Cellulomonas sp. APG4]|uniref:PLD nuclease N-terminal domain-containing protein n=1 Tax=Cellulomonas sp. APG4 TaxID=1538656 RepID=UPI0013798182|nr:PLD nuclease N-terminal domain-containing protein [Cellulomonas sp. APG4]NCT91646.1 PLDc_N domain-containing protein [Cellulomonas sp. APG4]